jgi:hypothetical protein
LMILISRIRFMRPLLYTRYVYRYV